MGVAKAATLSLQEGAEEQGARWRAACPPPSGAEMVWWCPRLKVWGPSPGSMGRSTPWSHRTRASWSADI